MINRKIVSIITILAIVQIACMGILGGTEEFPEESRPTTGATQTSPPDEQVQDPTTAPSELPPTEVAEEPAVATESGSPSDINIEPVSGMCSHPYYPINEELIWTYEITDSSTGPSIYTVEFEDVMEDSFMLVEEFYEVGGEQPTLSIEMNWLCTEDGLLSSDYGQLDVTSFGGDVEGVPTFTYETLEASGINLPVPDDWQVGSTWQTNYLMSGLSQIEGVGEITSTVEIRVENEIVSVESVSVEAGTYDEAVKVDGTTTITTTTFLIGMSTPFSISVDTQSWYVENVGLVKTMENEFASETELISLEQK